MRRSTRAGRNEAMANLPDPETQARLLELIEESGAVRRGHFRLASGRHSDVYVEKFRLLERPEVLAKICEPIVRRYRESRPTLVVGPSTGGLLVAYEVASQLALPAVYVETEGGKRVLKRGAHISSDARVLLVDDVLTTGVSLREVLDVIRESGAEVVGIGVLIDRSDVPVDFPVSLFSSSRFQATTYAENDLPAWLAEIPVHTPGTRAKVYV